ncbi:hypothetical protein DXG01_013240, partial [Tephrocybe rancida]
MKDLPKLSSKERDELRAQGKCFRCRETGHVSRHCPNGNTVKGGRNGKAPGYSAHAIDIDFEAAETLRESANLVDTIDSVQVSMMHWDIEPNVCRRPCIGDLAAQRAMTLLESQKPYPCDGPETLAPGERQFNVFSSGNGLHGIVDYEHALSGAETISTHLLFDEGFNLAEWFADRRAFRNAKNLDPENRWSRAPCMGDTLTLGVLAAIREGADEYPPRADGSRENDWEVEQNGSVFSIMEKNEGTCLNVDRVHIMDDTFDIISCYRD